MPVVAVIFTDGLRTEGIAGADCPHLADLRARGTGTRGGTEAFELRS